MNLTPENESSLKDEYKILIEIISGLTNAAGAAQQLVHSHGSHGNLGFDYIEGKITAIKEVISRVAVIPDKRYRDLKPAPFRGGFTTPDVFARRFADDILGNDKLIKGRIDERKGLIRDEQGEGTTKSNGDGTDSSYEDISPECYDNLGDDAAEIPARDDRAAEAGGTGGAVTGEIPYTKGSEGTI